MLAGFALRRLPAAFHPPPLPCHRGRAAVSAAFASAAFGHAGVDPRPRAANPKSLEKQPPSRGRRPRKRAVSHLAAAAAAAMAESCLVSTALPSPGARVRQAQLRLALRSSLDPQADEGSSPCPRIHQAVTLRRTQDGARVDRQTASRTCVLSVASVRSVRVSPMYYYYYYYYY